MATATRRIGPADHGQHLSLDEFADADFEDGWLYELACGVVVVTEVPGIPHAVIEMRVEDLFSGYSHAHPGVIHLRGTGGRCRLRLQGMQSDRNPDQAVYLTAPPIGRRPWTHWTPEIVVEIVSRGSENRDYVEKREEYLNLGVLEYWIIDRFRKRMLALQRAGDVWDEVVVEEDGTYSTNLLPSLIVRVVDIIAPVVYDNDDSGDPAEDENGDIGSH